MKSSKGKFDKKVSFPPCLPAIVIVKINLNPWKKRNQNNPQKF